jgi:hypothetical protein
MDTFRVCAAVHAERKIHAAHRLKTIPRHIAAHQLRLTDGGRNRSLSQIQSPGDVGVDKLLPAMRRDMGLVQRCGMKNNLNPAHAMHRDRTLRYRADISRKRRRKDIETHHLMVQIPQRSNQALTQVTGTSRDQEFHNRFMVNGTIEASPSTTTVNHSPSRITRAAAPSEALAISSAIERPPRTTALPQKRYSENQPSPSYTEEKTWSV